MKSIQTFLAVALLGLMSLGAQAQRADELAVDGPASAQERPQRQERGVRGTGGAPTLRDVRQAARDGDTAKARTLIDQVLQRQPDNARAHFVKAQLALRDKDVATARSELQAAERLAPGLPFAREQQVTSLRTRLDRMEVREARGGQPRGTGTARDGSVVRPDEAPARGPTSPPNDASTTTAANTPAETRPAGEDTRNMGAPAPQTTTADKGNNSLLLGLLIGGGVVAALAALLFRRRRPAQT